MKILIDNGHGSDTPGKRSPDGTLREYAWAREVANMICDLLQAEGYDASLLVPHWPRDAGGRTSTTRTTRSWCPSIATPPEAGASG